MTHVVSKITRAPLVHASQRKGIIGGSQVATLIKDSKGEPIHGVYSSEYETYMSYIGREEKPDDSAKESFYAGNRLEEAIAQWFSYDMQLKEPAHELDFQYVDPDDPRLVLHPDREFSVDGKRYALECKTASTYAMRGSKWPELVEIDPAKIPSFVPSLLEDGRPLCIYDGEKSIMPGYYYQCLWYYALAGYDGVFLARITDNRLFIYYVEPRLVVEKAVYNIARNWLKKVDAGYVPDPMTVVQARDKFPTYEKGKVFVADDKLMMKIEKLKAFNEQKSNIESLIDRYKADIINTIGDAEMVRDSEGQKLATCKTGHQSRVDTSTLKTAEPDVYKKYLVTIETARTLKIL